MELELRDRVAIVTGGASGIGAACARALSLEGAQVVVLDCDSRKGQELVSLILGQGGWACFVPADATGEAAVANAVNQTVTTL